MNEPSFSDKCALCGCEFGQHDGLWKCPTNRRQQFSAVPILDCPFCGRQPEVLANRNDTLALCQPCGLSWMEVERWNRRPNDTSALEIAPPNPNSCFFCKEWRDVDLERQRLKTALECACANFYAVNDMLARIGTAVGIVDLEDGFLEEHILESFALTTVAELHEMEAREVEMMHQRDEARASNASLRADCEIYKVTHEKQATTIGELRTALWNTETKRIETQAALSTKRNFDECERALYLRLDELEKRNAELADALRACQWGTGYGFHCCPICLKVEAEHHGQNCPAGKALAKFDAEATP